MAKEPAIVGGAVAAGVFYMNEAAFDLPDLDLRDSSVTSLDAKAPSGETMGIRVHRQALPADRTLREIVAEHVAEAHRALPAYALEWQRDIEVAGVPAIELAARWRGSEGMNYTRHAHLALPGMWLIISVNGALGDMATVDATHEHVVGTLRFAR